MICRRIDELQDQENLQALSRLHVGLKVTFGESRTGLTMGIVTKINRKSVIVLAENGTKQYKVSPELLRPLRDVRSQCQYVSGIETLTSHMGRVAAADISVATHLSTNGRRRSMDQTSNPAQAEVLGVADLDGGALFNAEFGIRHRGSTVPERSGVALSFCRRPPCVVMAVSVRYHFESGLPREREFKRGPTVFAGDGHVAFVEVHR
ncbi:hypothetical protein SSTU70S_02725 [Stutzerimonas stutzeri]